MTSHEQNRGERNGWADSSSQAEQTPRSYGMPDWYWRLNNAVLLALTVFVVLGLAVGVVFAVWWIATR
jgi:hypothetical protein